MPHAVWSKYSGRGFLWTGLYAALLLIIVFLLTAEAAGAHAAGQGGKGTLHGMRADCLAKVFAGSLC